MDSTVEIMGRGIEDFFKFVFMVLGSILFVLMLPLLMIGVYGANKASQNCDQCMDH